MDPPATAFFGRRRSSVAPPEDIGAPATSSDSLVAPRKASTWDSMPVPSGNSASASDISARRASATTGNPTQPPAEYSTAGSIAGRRASSWDDTPHGGGPRGSVSDIAGRRASATTGNPTQPPTEYSTAGNIAGQRASSWDDTPHGGGPRGSVSDIAGRRATATDRPPWDRFAGPPPAYEGSTWAWMDHIAAIISSPTPASTFTERNRLFYMGNLDYIFDNFNEQTLAMENLKAVMYTYGVEMGSVEDIEKKIDPGMHGIFSINAPNKQILLATNMSFSYPRDPLDNLRQASKCFQQNLLAPLHFAGYIFDILIESGRLGELPPFMILGMYGIFGISGGFTSDMLSTEDVETFISIWKVLNLDEAQDLKNIIDYDQNGLISVYGFYNLLYRRNVFGKQRIEMFDMLGPHDPSLFFPLMDKDKDGFLLPADLRTFAGTFGRDPTNEAIDHVTRKLDFDGDGKINCEDFRRAMMPVLEGMTWEFWLVAILLRLEL